MQLTEQQESMITSDEFDDEEFFRIVTLKEERLTALSKLDDGFEQLFESVKEELFLSKEKYVKEITVLKQLIASITDVSVRLQALETRNKAKMDVYFSNKRNEIKRSRLSNKTVTNYYKTVTKQNEAESFFYDKKN
jgi:hypothetical protein